MYNLQKKLWKIDKFKKKIRLKYHRGHRKKKDDAKRNYNET